LMNGGETVDVLMWNASGTDAPESQETCQTGESGLVPWKRACLGHFRLERRAAVPAYCFQSGLNAIYFIIYNQKLQTGRTMP
jgi:hypothetical protein